MLAVFVCTVLDFPWAWFICCWSGYGQILGALLRCIAFALYCWSSLSLFFSCLVLLIVNSVNLSVLYHTQMRCFLCSFFLMTDGSCMIFMLMLWYWTMWLMLLIRFSDRDYNSFVWKAGPYLWWSSNDTNSNTICGTLIFY